MAAMLVNRSRWRPSLLTNRDEKSIFIEDLPYMLSTQFQFIREIGFREDLLEINQSEKRMACVAMFVNGSGRNEQTL